MITQLGHSNSCLVPQELLVKVSAGLGEKSLTDRGALRSTFTDLPSKCKERTGSDYHEMTSCIHPAQLITRKLTRLVNQLILLHLSLFVVGGRARRSPRGKQQESRGGFRLDQSIKGSQLSLRCRLTLRRVLALISKSVAVLHLRPAEVIILLTLNPLSRYPLLVSMCLHCSGIAF